MSVYKPIEEPRTWRKNFSWIFYFLVAIIIGIVHLISKDKTFRWIGIFIFGLWGIESFRKSRRYGTYFFEIDNLNLRWKLPFMEKEELRNITEFKRIVIKPKELVFFRDSSFMDFIPLPQFNEVDQVNIVEQISLKAKENDIELIVR